MASYIIEGGKKLEGESNVEGSKNASLPIIAGTILNGSESKLYNVPNISDIKITLKILSNLGCKIHSKNDKITVNSMGINKYEIPDELMRQMRSSVVLAGALIGRFKKAKFSYPGGCDIGVRPIDLHLKGFRKLGIDIKEEAGYIICECDEITGAEIHLDFPSVGATENIILASVFASGKTTITNAAMEPEIEDLQNFLNKMGAKVKGAGTNTVIIEGVKNLKNVSYNIMPDRIEAGTLLCATAITGGKIKLNNVKLDHIVPIINKLQECGCEININNNSLILNAPKRLKSTDIKTMPYPGFPTDMQSIFASMLCVAKGTAIITENIFENRYKYLNELKRMGANVKIEGKNAIIKGTRKLYGTNVKATDLRGGVAMVIVALYAKGITRVNNIEHILRGYENLEIKLQKLGANIEKED